MPNWSFNTIAVKGKKQDVIDFFNKAIKEKRNRELLTIDMSGEQIAKRLCEIKEGKCPIHLRSWLPMPKTFIEWDTTNDILSFNGWVDMKLGTYWGRAKPTPQAIKKFEALSEGERKDEYEKYKINWAKAKQAQKDKYGVFGWYDYNLKTLGTKWDCNFEDFLCDDCGDDLVIRMYCETAWSFPDNWIETMQAENPKLVFFCYAWEESYDYCGYFKAGDVDWIEDYGRGLYDSCVGEVRSSEDYDEESEDEQIYELISEKEDEMYEKFRDYVLNYEV